MSNSLKLGLGNTVADKTVIFHGGITTRDSFGRVTDLVVVWTKKEHNLNQKLSGDLRVLVQGLLEFGFPPNKSSVGHLEMAIEEQNIYVGLRFENFIVEEGDDIEKKLAQYWLNSEESSLIKRILYPQDRVEVRFLKELNLLEWRIIRSLSLESLNLDAVSFQVFSEIEDGLMSDHDQFVEMGDVHYDDWISEVYQNSHEKNKSGELFQDGESVQGEAEWARVVSEHDQKVIDETVKVFKAQAEASDNDEVVFKSEQSTSGAAVETVKGKMVSEVDLLNEKIKQYEKLLKQKEKQNQKMGMEIVSLQEKVSNVIKVSQNTDVKQVQLFRDKAMQMFEMVKALQVDKQALEKTIFEMKRGGGSAGIGAKASSDPGLILQVEELSKKSERLTRALEAEKQKVKGLLDRAMLAEKEVQGSTSATGELERKAENALKLVQVSKKETEVVKQKLMQSEAEKNKIKNDLIKAQAQIQTLMKRQAS